MSELELELESIVGVCNAEGSQPLKDTLARCMIRRLFYFSGGGTTKMNDCQEKGDNNSKVMLNLQTWDGVCDDTLPMLRGLVSDWRLL